MTTALAKTNFDPEQLAVIEAQFFPSGATKSEQQYCLGVARELKLNPITGEIFFVPRRQKIGDKWVNKIEPMVGRDGFLSIAHRSGQLAGMETTTCIKDVPKLINGNFTPHQDLVATCTVWRRDSTRHFSAEVSAGEYMQKGSDGQPTRFWAEKTETMLRKVAESQALRKAFNIHGVYCPEELGAGFETEGGNIVTTTIEAEFSRAVAPPSRLTVVPPAVVPPQQEAPPVAVVVPPSVQAGPPPGSTAPRPIVIDEDGWPDPPASSPSQTQSHPQEPSPTLPVPVSTGDSVADEIINLLVGKKIPYEFDREAGIISAKSYDHKELLKQSGFRWSSDLKSWLFKFDPIPF